MLILASDGIEEAGKRVVGEAGHELRDKRYTAEELAAGIHEYDAIIVRSATKVTKEVIDKGLKLKAIGRAGVGIDNIDSAYAKEKGIPVLNTPGASSISVAELAIAHMFAAARFLNRSKAEMMQGAWPKKQYAGGFELTGKTLGLLGFGNIGRETAKRGIGLGMDVIAYDPFIKDTDMKVTLVTKDELLANSDVISLHMPYIKAEGPTLTAVEFAKMKRGVVVVNCARGGVVSEKDLLAAIETGIVRYAGIDVWENEPITEAQMALVKHPAVSVSPHIGASTDEAQIRVGVEIARKIVEELNKHK